MKRTIMIAATVVGVALCGLAAPRKTVVVWSEGTAPKNVYPNDINTAIAEGFRASEQMKDWARMMDIEFVHINKDTTIDALEHDLFLSDLAWKLK